MGQLSNITTRWRHQTVIKEREIKVNNFYQKVVKDFMFYNLMCEMYNWLSDLKYDNTLNNTVSQKWIIEELPIFFSSF